MDPQENFTDLFMVPSSSLLVKWDHYIWFVLHCNAHTYKIWNLSKHSAKKFLLNICSIFSHFLAYPLSDMHGFLYSYFILIFLDCANLWSSCLALSRVMLPFSSPISCTSVKVDRSVELVDAVYNSTFLNILPVKPSSEMGSPRG